MIIYIRAIDTENSDYQDAVIPVDAEGGSARLPGGERIEYRDASGDPDGGVWVAECGEIYVAVEPDDARRERERD